MKKGEIGNLRSLNGNWMLSNDGKLQIIFTVEGQTHTQSAKLSFDGEEMVLTDDKGRKLGIVGTRGRSRNGSNSNMALSQRSCHEPPCEGKQHIQYVSQLIKRD